MKHERRQVVVIGAGQAGLAMGYCLAQHGIDFVLLDSAKQIGDSWRSRWDSLALFTPTELDGLPGLPFPAPPRSYPNKDQMADYLARYAEHFNLPVRLDSPVTSLTRATSGRDAASPTSGRDAASPTSGRDAASPTSGSYEIATPGVHYEAQRVVISIGAYQTPFIPAFHADLAEDVVKLHSSQYRSAAQLGPGNVIVVGTGNSGVQIAMDLSRTHEVFLSGRQNRHMPKRFLGLDIHKLPDLLGATRIKLDAPWFRKAMTRVRSRLQGRERRRTQGDRLVGLNLAQVTKEYALRRVPRAVAARGREVVFANGDSVRADNVLWATGFQWDAPWIHLPVFDDDGLPLHDGGPAPGAAGVYFLGLRYLRRFNSSLVYGVGRDASVLAEHIQQSFAS